MLDVNFNLNLKGTLIGIGHIGPGTGDTSQAPQKLSVPWQRDPQKTAFSLLTWHSAISQFKGRDQQMAELEQWAYDGPTISLKFVAGPGGVGKSRLAAEFAKHLQNRGWSAGSWVCSSGMIETLKRI